MASIQELLNMGKEMGMVEEKLQSFVEKQQEIQRAERADQRQVDKELREVEQRKLDAEVEQRKLDAETEHRRMEVEKEQKKIETEQQRMELESAERKKKLELEHELELARINVQSQQTQSDSRGGPGRSNGAKVPRLPTFQDGKDSLDAYLERFERFATNHQWPKETWASSLSALITGKALEVYSRLSA